MRQKDSVEIIPESYEDIMPFIMDTLNQRLANGRSSRYEAEWLARNASDKVIDPYNVNSNVSPFIRVVFHPGYLIGAADKVVGFSYTDRGFYNVYHGARDARRRGYLVDRPSGVGDTIVPGKPFDPYKAHYMLSSVFDVDDDQIFAAISRAMVHSRRHVLSLDDFEFCAHYLEDQYKTRPEWISEVLQITEKILEGTKQEYPSNWESNQLIAKHINTVIGLLDEQEKAAFIDSITAILKPAREGLRGSNDSRYRMLYNLDIPGKDQLRAYLSFFYTGHGRLDHTTELDRYYKDADPEAAAAEIVAKFEEYGFGERELDSYIKHSYISEELEGALVRAKQRRFDSSGPNVQAVMDGGANGEHIAGVDRLVELPLRVIEPRSR